MRKIRGHEYLLPCLLIAVSFAHAAKPQKTAKQRTTLKTIAEFVLKNGVDQTISPPLSTNLGLAPDEIPTKALRHKSSASPDKRIHGFYVLYESDGKGNLTPTGIVLSNALVTKKNDSKFVQGFDARVDMDGKLLAAVHSSGPAGDVEQTKLAVDSKEAIAAYTEEKKLFLDRTDYKKLSK